MENFEYSGSELHLFAFAKNWKKYWSKEIQSFMGSHILEVGAGIGATAKALCAGRFTSWACLEPDQKLCAQIQQEVSLGNLPAHLNIRTATTSNLEAKEKFDTILYIDVLEHIKDDVGELQKISDHLVVGGKVIIVSPAHNFLYAKMDENVGHYRRYNAKMLKAIVPPKLSVERIRYLDSVGMLASLASKVFIKSGEPTQGKIYFWDTFMVTASRILDPLFGYQLGKSIICVLEKKI